MRPGRDADGPGSADVDELRLESAVAVEYLNAAVFPVGHVDVALRVGGNRVQHVELSGRGAARAPALDVLAVFVEFGDARIAVAVGHVDVACGIPGDVGRPVEIIAGYADAGRRRCWCCCGGSAPAGASAGCRLGLIPRHGNRFRLAAHGHHDAPLGIELDDHVRSFVHHPDVVLGIDANVVGEDKAVNSLSDLAHEFSGLVILEQPRGAAHEHAVRSHRRIGRARTRVYEDMSLGVSGYADGLSQDGHVARVEEIGR